MLRERHLNPSKVRKTGLLDDVVDLLAHRVSRERVSSDLDKYCREVSNAHVHWYSTNTPTVSAFDLTTPDRCMHGTLIGSEVQLVDTLSTNARSHRLTPAELLPLLVQHRW